MDKNKMYGENQKTNDQMNGREQHGMTGNAMKGQEGEKFNQTEQPTGGMNDKNKGAESACKDKMGEHASMCESGKKEAKGENCSTEKSGQNGGCCGQKS